MSMEAAPDFDPTVFDPAILAELQAPQPPIEHDVIIPYRPRKAFENFHNSDKRWSILVAHRRAGKTVAAINKLLKEALLCKHPHGRYGYIGPYLSQAKEIVWDYLKRYSESARSGPPNEAELRIQLVNGATIRLHGADNPDRLRGPYLDGVVFDEYADQREGIWTSVVRPMLADRQGWAAFIGTPKGRNAFYKLWSDAAENPDWFRALIRCDTSGILSLEELDDMQETMSPEEFDMEMRCAWEQPVQGAFYADQMRRMDAEGRICKLDVDRGVRVHTAWDMGRRDASAVWFIQAVGRERRMVDYAEFTGSGLHEYATLLYDKKAERNWVYGEHFFPHDIGIHTIDSPMSRIETLASLGIEVTKVADHARMDGINAVRRMLDRSYIDPVRCARGIEVLRNYRREYDSKLKDWKTNPMHDWASHGADALRSFAAGFDDPKAATSADGRYRRRFGGQQPKKSSWSA